MLLTETGKGFVGSTVFNFRGKRAELKYAGNNQTRLPLLMIKVLRKVFHSVEFMKLSPTTLETFPCVLSIRQDIQNTSCLAAEGHRWNSSL